jgi:hypothetical protein
VKNFTVFFSVIVLLSLFTITLRGEEPEILVQEEAPATIWDMDIGDTDVDLYLAGYWKMGLMGGTAASWSSDGVDFPTDFPGLTSFSFYQAPDLTISLWLMNRYYLETSFVEGFDKNTYAIGYRGMEGEFLQSVRIGNSEITIDDYTGLSVPNAEYNTPGISASFETETTYHDVMVRYDPTSEESKTFLGEYEVTEEVINLGDYVRGQYFILPDEDIDSITVYIADEDGSYTGSDGLTYSVASDNEASYSLSDGTVTMTDASDVDILVFYEKSGVDVGDITVTENFIVPLVNGEPDPDGTALPFSWTDTDTWDTGSATVTYADTRKVTINGNDALKIYNPDKFGPFEYFNIYEVSSNLSSYSWKNSVSLVDKSYVEASDSDDFDFDTDSDDSIITVYVAGDTDVRSAWTRYPLADDYSIIYGSDTTEDDLTGRSILLSVKGSSTGYDLGSGVLQGSVEIYINGNKTTSYSVDYDSGEVTFNQYIYSTDRIEISYRTETIDLTGGDLLFAQGNRFNPTENLNFYLAEMFRWNVTDTSNSSLDDTSAGGLYVVGGMDYSSDYFNMELNTSVSLQTDDTTGYLSVQGMEDSGYSFSIGEDLLKQAPEDIDILSLDSSDREDLIYMDYFSTNGYGEYYLNSYTWSGAEEDEDESGPSVASGISSDDFDSYVMVMEYENLDNTEWSAGDLIFSTDGTMDLSRFTSVSMSFKTLDSTDLTNITVTILIGENGEREDWDDDGQTSSEDTSLIYSEDVTTFLDSSDGEWADYEHEFTTSEMDQLTKCRSLRVVVQSTASDLSGRLLIADVQFEGSLFDYELYDNSGTEISSDDKLTVTETDDSTAQSLEDDFDEVDELFHSSGEDQKSLKVEWGDPTIIATDDYWVVETYTEAIPIDSYETFSFYMKSTSTDSFTIQLADSDEEGYSFDYTPSSTDWVKLNLDLETGKVTDSDGSTLATATIDSTDDALTLFRVTFKGDDTSGTVYIDELHYSDPTFSLEGTVELTTTYAYPGDIITTSGGFPILSDFTFYNQLNYTGSKVLTNSADSSHSLQNDTTVSAELIFVEIEANMKVEWDESSTELSGSHDLSFPSDFKYGNITDSYSRSGDSDSSTMTRENALLVKIPEKGSLKGIVSAEGDDSDQLIQTWEGDTSWNITSLFTAGWTLTFEQESEWDYRNQDNYFMNWIEDYRLIAPVDEEVDNRGVSTEMDFNLKTSPVALTLSPYLSFETETGTTYEQENEGGFTLSTPISLVSSSGNDWSIAPSYSRSFTQESEKNSGNSFSEGFNNLSQDLSNWLPLTSFIPFYELFATSPVSDFEDLTESFDDADYSPSMSVAVSRKFGSEIHDLFVPYYFNVDYSRNFNKSDDTLSNSNSLDFTIKQTAINLFGEFGVYRQFSSYNTDEFTSSLQFNMSAEGSNIPEPDEIIYQNYLSFYGNNNASLTFENRFENDFQDEELSDSLDLKFIWQQPMVDKFAIDYLNTLIKKEHFWSHEETLQFDMSYPYNDDDESASLTVYVKHLSKVTVPDLGSFKTWLTLGFYGEDDLFMAGFETGVELIVSF